MDSLSETRRRPSEILSRALPDHARFDFEVEHKRKHGCIVVVKLKHGTFADGESARRVYVPYRAVYTNLEAVAVMVVETSEHALEEERIP